MKKRTFLISFLILSVLGVIGGLNAWVLAAPDDRLAPTATVTVDEGEAFLQKKGSSERSPVSVDAEVSVGDAISTGDESQATINFFDSASARLDENSEVVIQTLDVDDDNQTSVDVDFAVVAGRVWSRVLKFVDPDSSYTVQASSVVATVRGTSFVVDSTDREEDRVQVVDGEVAVATAEDAESSIDEDWESVGGGEEARVSREKEQGVKRILRRARMKSDLKNSAWFKKNVSADEKYVQFVEQRREKLLKQSAGALPGTISYPVKRFGEKLRIAVTTDADARRKLQMAYQGRRFSESVQLARSGKNERAEKSWNAYLKGFRSIRNDLERSGVDRERASCISRQMIGRMIEHQNLVGNINGSGVSVPENLKTRISGDRSDIGIMVSGLREKFPGMEDCKGRAQVPVERFRFFPRIIERLVPTSTEEILDETLDESLPTNTNKPTLVKPPIDQPVEPPPPEPTPPPDVVSESLRVIGTRNIMNTPDSQQFRAVLIMSDGSTVDVTTNAAWTLEGDPAGTLTGGYLTTSGPGNVLVRANYQQFSASYSVRILPPQEVQLQSLQISPASVDVFSGGSQSFTSRAYYSDGSNRDVTAQTAWSVSGDPIGSMDASYLYTYMQNAGVMYVTGSYSEGGVTQSHTATVNVSY